MSDKCIVHGCKNHRHEGRFVGDLCAPCHTMLAYGEIHPSFAFFAVEIIRLRSEVKKLRAEVQTWQGHAKTAVWSDSEECKLLTRINAALLEAPSVDVEVVVPDRDYATMTPKDCYEAGLLDGVHQAREAIKAAARAALAEEKKG